jgi:hypothetical protein
LWNHRKLKREAKMLVLSGGRNGMEQNRAQQNREAQIRLEYQAESRITGAEII